MQLVSAIDQIQEWEIHTPGDHGQHQQVVHACRVTVLLEANEVSKLVGRRGSVAKLEAVSGRRDRGVKLVRRHENEVTFMVEPEYRVGTGSFTPEGTGRVIMDRLTELMSS